MSKFVQFITLIFQILAITYGNTIIAKVNQLLNKHHQHAQFFDYDLSFFEDLSYLDLPSYEPVPVGVSAVQESAAPTPL